MDAGQEFGGESAPTTVPPFGPWIRKKKMKSRYAFGWDQMFYSVRNLESEHAHIL
jgi:hypothetical protein